MELNKEGLCINGVTVSSLSRNKITIPISHCSNLKTAETKALIDSGAEGKFIDGSIVNWKKITRLKKPITVQNVDGTNNEMGKICYKMKICYNIEKDKFEDWFYTVGNKTVAMFGQVGKVGHCWHLENGKKWGKFRVDRDAS